MFFIALIVITNVFVAIVGLIDLAREACCANKTQKKVMISGIHMRLKKKGIDKHRVKLEKKLDAK